MQQVVEDRTRGTQLALSILAVVLSVGAYVLVTLGKTGKTPPGIGGFVAVVGLSYLLAHLLTTRLAPGADPVLLPVAAVLAGVGYAMISRLDPGLAEEQFGWLMLGLARFAATLLIVRDHRVLDAYTDTIGLVGSLCLVLFIARALIGYAAFAQVQNRVTVCLHALETRYVHGDGYQIAQGEFAMATGGIAGTGLGQGHPGLIPF